VTGRALVRLAPGATIDVARNGRLTIGNGGSQEIFDADKLRAAIALGADARLRVNGRARLGYGSKLRVGPGARVELGDGVFLNGRCEIICTKGITIGDGTVVGWNTHILDNTSHAVSTDGGATWKPTIAPIAVGANCWIGAECLILKGVTIGDGAVIAARSVVTRDVAPRSLVGGAPATEIRPDIRWRPSPEGSVRL